LNYLKNFEIPFRGLSLGDHDYDWEIDKTFFEALENHEIEDGKLTINLKFEKQDRMMILDFEINGEVYTVCDRCNDTLSLPVEVRETMIIKFGAERKEESEEVLIIPEKDYKIDISKFINEYVTLSLPIKKIHPEDDSGKSGCNEEVIKKLKELTERNTIDPRWEKLKDLKTK